MRWLLFWSIFFVLAQCALFSSRHKLKVKGNVPGKKLNHSKIARNDVAPFKCDPTQRVHIPYNIDATFKERTFDAISKSLDYFISSTCLTFEWVDNIDDLAPRFENGTGIRFRPTTYDFPYPAQFYFNAKNLIVTELRVCEVLDVQFDAVVARTNQQLYYGLGFLPEHKRSDRDSYVTIMTDNIDPSWRVEYDVNRNAPTDLPFDYTSVGNFYPSDGAINPSRLVYKSKTQTPVTMNFVLSLADAFKINQKYCRKCMP